MKITEILQYLMLSGGRATITMANGDVFNETELLYLADDNEFYSKRKRLDENGEEWITTFPINALEVVSVDNMLTPVNDDESRRSFYRYTDSTEKLGSISVVASHKDTAYLKFEGIDKYKLGE